MQIFYATVGAMLVMALGEWLHLRRCRRVARLAFGPQGEPRRWTRAVPWVRVVCVGAMTWGFATLLHIGPQSVRTETIPEGGYRHLVIALDVSPSMKLQDSGTGAKLTRAQRASEVLMSLLQRIAADQVRISIVAFYTDAKPVMIDTFDMEVVKNALNDLPLDLAFDVGKTSLLEGIRQSVELARPWQPDSTTLVVVTDGDTLPDSGMPELPSSIEQVLIVGVGDTRTGRFIDGHQSRQDTATLRQLAKRLRGEYFDANEKHLSSELISTLSETLPLRKSRGHSLRAWALVAIGSGGIILAVIPLALAFLGSAWQAGAGSKRALFAKGRSLPCRADVVTNKDEEKITYA